MKVIERNPRSKILIDENFVDKHAKIHEGVINIENLTTKELFDELSIRAGVIKNWATDDNEIVIKTDSPMHVLVIYD